MSGSSCANRNSDGFDGGAGTEAKIQEITEESTTKSSGGNSSQQKATDEISSQKNRGATPKVRPESTTSRALNFDDTDNGGSGGGGGSRFAKLTINPGRSGSDAGIILSKSASSSPAHNKLQHQQSQPVVQRSEQLKNHPIRTSASASNVAFSSSGSGSIQLRKTSYKNQQSHSLRYSGSGSDVSNLVS